MKKLSFDQSERVFYSKVYENWTLEQIVYFQLKQRYLCVPVRTFYKGLKKYTGQENLSFKKGEYDKTKAKKLLRILIDNTKMRRPSFDELIPKKLQYILEIKDLFIGTYRANQYALKYHTNGKKDNTTKKTERNNNSGLARKRRRTR